MTKHLTILLIMTTFGCGTKKELKPNTSRSRPFLWENATIYFLLTDRFNNGDKSNDYQHPVLPAPYRGYMGGDVKGITDKIEDGYFDKLGVDAIWMTPLVENITSSVNEGTGNTYGFHGYWTKDWTAFDKRIGNEKDVAKMVDAAHKKNIRILMDVVINHTGPVTPSDEKWPDEWVRTSPRCTYKGYVSTTSCVLVDNLPDIKTESLANVNLPVFLIEKWKAEGRYQKEMNELDAFFKRTKYPRRPYYYIVKWLTDLIRKYGIDGFRVDTVKHTEEEVWKTLFDEATIAFNDWKKSHPSEVLDDSKFYMVGEVYNYNAGNGREFDFGDRKVDYFKYGFHSLINFGFKYDAKEPYNILFTKYGEMVNGALKGKCMLNYISSHDDGSPFDIERKFPYESATKLLLSSGAAQIYYGDESARSLNVNAEGDARLRSYMNWSEQNEKEKLNILTHWQKLGQFRRNHVCIGAGKHHIISEKPCVFARTLVQDKISDVVVCAIDVEKGKKSIELQSFFKDGDQLLDTYSGQKAVVRSGKITINTPFTIVLLAKAK